MSDELEKGLEIFGDVYGQEMADGCRAAIDAPEGFIGLQAKWTMEWAFGSVWARDGMTRKMRSCAVLGMMIGLRQFEEIQLHTRMGMVNGLTREEIEEIFYSAIPYCGFPIANTAKAAMLAGIEDFEQAKKE